MEISKIRGMRNCNPGNIVRNMTRWQGMSANQSDSRFCVFDSMEWGCRALIKTLMTYRRKHGLNSIRSMISRWAPSFENDTAAYMFSVAKAIGVKQNDVLPENRETYIALAKAIAAVENGKTAASTISEETWQAAADLAGL